MIIKTFCGGYDKNFTYIVHDDKNGIVIDPALPVQGILKYIKEKNLSLKFVVFLHSHFDHVVDLGEYHRLKIPVYGHESTKIKVDRKLKDKDTIGFDDIKFKVLHTPGHRYDCLCLLTGNSLFTSDTLFVEGCGRVDLPGSDPALMMKTLERLKQLPENTVIYPGHDYGSTKTSTMGREKKNNPFLMMNKEEFINVRLSY